jgi:DNA repair protein RadA/Sms
LVAGSVVLMAGEPGVGKSTLMLQLAAGVEAQKNHVTYFCGEESPEQVAARARRLGSPTNTHLSDANDVDQIAPLLGKTNLAIVDSVQTIRDPEAPGEVGSVSQVRISAAALVRAARASSTPVLLVGHICKDGSIAGPRALEHVVDVVLTFEGDRGHALRTVRSVKNRFGPTGEVGVFEMTSQGLREVKDASRLFLRGRRAEVAGSAIGCVLEGRRPMALEVQTLTVCTKAAFPKRVAQGLEAARLGLALAVLDRRADIRFAECDVYASVAGGFKASEPGIDLALFIALASSATNRATPAGLAAVGEVGLAGEVRPVEGLDLRIRELIRLGFTTVIAPVVEMSPPIPEGLEPPIERAKVIRVKTLVQAIGYLN